MKFASTTALALALALGAVAVTGATPAAAAKKADTAASGKRNFSPAFVKAVQPLQTALTGGDMAAAKAALPAAQAAATTDDDKFQVVADQLPDRAEDQRRRPAPQQRSTRCWRAARRRPSSSRSC